jgi:hypothetical protein
MKMKSILSGLIVVCAVCMCLATSCAQASNESTEETPMAIMSVRYVVDDVDAAIEFYTKLTGLASVRYLIDDARSCRLLYYSPRLGPCPHRGCYRHHQWASQGHRGRRSGVDRHEPRWAGSGPLPLFPQRRLTRLWCRVSPCRM